MHKYDGVEEGDYVMVYNDSNIYKVYSNGSGLYIEFRGKETPLKSFGKLLYKKFTDEEIVKAGVKL